MSVFVFANQQVSEVITLNGIVYVLDRSTDKIILCSQERFRKLGETRVIGGKLYYVYKIFSNDDHESNYDFSVKNVVWYPYDGTI